MVYNIFEKTLYDIFTQKAKPQILAIGNIIDLCFKLDFSKEQTFQLAEIKHHIRKNNHKFNKPKIFQQHFQDKYKDLTWESKAIFDVYNNQHSHDAKRLFN
ncbi:hypothetical protein Glove_276g39 [Diversispora epigaea]|uniref:Uncharacterized protein n=1 Tax=Diversispora epigaea TaxID=1348612 RepID=A0A397I6P6_9GLOM|nr:hypothetical protein Glove_276g39 [Diversispora epigaea]